MSDDTLTGNDFTTEKDPVSLFRRWFIEAKAHEINDPDAMSLASVDEAGMPDVRMVLLKEADERGFVFYTNYESRKGEQILGSMKAALCFHWKSLRRQVRIRGLVERVCDAEADAYFASRPRGSKTGAWASRQSRPLESRFALEKSVAEISARYAFGSIPRPAHWSGFRVLPTSIEFWRDRPFRLHDRLLFTRTTPDCKHWKTSRLYP